MEPYDFYRDIYRMYHVNPTKYEKQLLNYFLSLKNFCFDFVYVKEPNLPSVKHFSLESHVSPTVL